MNKSSKILNLTNYHFTDKQVDAIQNKSLVEIMLNKFNTTPSIPTNVKRAMAVADFVKKKGYLMAIIDCPNFMVLTLQNVFMNEGLFLIFTYEDEKGNIMMIDVNGNEIKRGGV
jgi:hypothetical protein